MNIFNRFFLRRPVFTVLLVLLLALAVGFSCIGCSSWSSARAQIAQINSGYRTLALPTPLDNNRFLGIRIKEDESGDGNVHFLDGGIFYGKKNIEAVAEKAPQVERIERCGLLSAALKDYRGLSSEALDITTYNRAFDYNTYSFCVLALKCTYLEEIGFRTFGLNNEYLEYVPYYAEFEVLGAPSLHPAYGDLTGKNVCLQSGYTCLLTNDDGSPPFEEGKTYLIRCFYLDLPIHLVMNSDLSITPVQREESYDPDRPNAPFHRNIAFSTSADTLHDMEAVNPNLRYEALEAKTIPIDENTSQTFYIYGFPEDSLPYFAEYTGDWEDFLNTEDGAVWRGTIIPWTKLNQDSAAVVLTDDLNSIYNFNAGIASIMDGRAFTQEEYESGSSVCLVSSGFAMYNGLSVGDTVSLDYYHTKVVEECIDYYKSYLETTGDSLFARLTLCPEDRIGVEKEYTIVGIYSAPEFSPGQYNFSADTIFVPKSSVENAEAYEEPDVAYLNSIILKNGTEDAFEAYMQEHDMGESFVYTNMSFDAVLPALEAMAANALRLFLIGIALFVLVAATGGMLILLRVKPTVRSARLIGAEPPLLRKQLACSLLVPFSAAALLGASAGAAFFGSVTKALLENTQEMDLTALLLCAAAELVLLLVLGVLLGFAASPKLMDSTKRPKGAKR